jgi:hypothetical protein
MLNGEQTKTNQSCGVILYAKRWDASLAIIRSLALVLAWDLTPMIPPPHCRRNSSNRSLKFACVQSQPTSPSALNIHLVHWQTTSYKTLFHKDRSTIMRNQIAGDVAFSIVLSCWHGNGDKKKNKINTLNHQRCLWWQSGGLLLTKWRNTSILGRSYKAKELTNQVSLQRQERKHSKHKSKRQQWQTFTASTIFEKSCLSSFFTDVKHNAVAVLLCTICRGRKNISVQPYIMYY